MAQSSPLARDWRVEDSISTQYIVEDQRSPELWPQTSAGQRVHTSQDGELFFVVVKRGEVACDCNIYDLLVYSALDIRAALVTRRPPVTGTPLHTVSMSSTGSTNNAAAIREVHWETDTTLLFFGTGEGRSNYALYRLNVTDGSVELLTDESRNVDTYTLRNSSIVYTDVKAEPVSPVSEYPVVPIRGSYLGGNNLRRIVTVVAEGADGDVREIAEYESPLTNEPIEPAISPDGRWVVVPTPMLTSQGALPAGWEAYDGLDLPIELLPYPEQRRLWRLTLVEISTGQKRVLIDAPLGPPGTSLRTGLIEVLWSSDSRHIVVANTSLPIGSTEPRWKSDGYIVEIDASTGVLTVLEPMASNDTRADAAEATRVRSLGWSDDDRELLIYRGSPGVDAGGSGSAYQVSGRPWTRRSVANGQPTIAPRRRSDHMPNGLLVEVIEDQNTPPKVIASDGTHRAVIFGDEERSDAPWRADTRTIEWVEQGNTIAAGGLLLPRNGGTEPPPLVIQLGAYLPDRFRPDGSVPTSFAAQSLVAQGFAVLNLDPRVAIDYPVEMRDADRGRYKWIECQLVLDRINAAIDVLAAEGTIDPERVALVGFSRTGYYVYYAITQSAPSRFAAAIVADSTTGGFGEYVGAQASESGAALSWHAGRIEAQFGGDFWTNKSTWIERSPPFNVEKIDAPALFTYTALTPYSAAYEVLGAFRLSRREVDILLFPQGNHQIQRPRQRRAAIESTVDWMNFWLRGVEDQDEAKASQYRYWRELREQRRSRHSEDAE